MTDEEDFFDYSLINTNKILKNEYRRNICRIEYYVDNKPVYGTGFFCKIDYIYNKKMPVLITCEHVLDDYFFQNYEYLSVSYSSNNEIFSPIISLKNKRIIRDEGSDLTIIEINDKDEGLDIYSFLEIDNSVDLENPQLINKKVYLYHYPKGVEDEYYSQGYITNMSNEDNYFITKLSTLPGTSGAPIINYENDRVIGIHKAKYKYDINYGIGIFIKKGIQEFINKEILNIHIPYDDLYNYLNIIDIIYIIPINDDKIQLFGAEFVEKNKNRCKIIYKNREEPLKQFHKLTNEDKKSSILTIKLKGLNLVTDMKNMFRFCKYLQKLPNISRIDTSRVIDISRMFEKCDNLIELPDLSRWNVENVISMRGMFYNSFNLKSIPGIDNWNPIKLKDCYEMFCGCKSLKNSEVGKIEKWTNVNEEIKNKAFVGHEYGKKLNKISHSFDLTCQFIGNLIHKK